MSASPSATKEIVKGAVQANKEHQYALKLYIERLDAELATVDKLLNICEIPEDNEPELNVGGYIDIPGSKKAEGPVSLDDLSSQDSPFCDDAARRTRYLEFTSVHPMKIKELDALAEAVKTDNYRRHAFDAQRRGLDPFSNLDDRAQKAIEVNTEGLDWERIAEKVSSASILPRTPRECEIRWVGDRHPNINHETWKADELTKLKTAVSSYEEGQVNWVDVAHKLGTDRTPIDCMRHAILRKQHIWNSVSDTRLLEAVKVYGIDNWPLVARQVSEDASAAQCQSRYLRSLNPSLKRGVWTEEEDELLRVAVSVYDNSWTDIATFIPGRSNEQCRDRWSDKIRPHVSKGRWTDEEDEKLLDAVKALGSSSKWAKISERVERTDSMCRARYDTLMRRNPKGLAKFATDDDGQDIEIQFPSPSHFAGSSKRISTAQTLHPVSHKNPEFAMGFEEYNPQQHRGVELSIPPTPGTAVTIQRPKPKPRTKGKGKQATPHTEPQVVSDVSSSSGKEKASSNPIGAKRTDEAPTGPQKRRKTGKQAVTETHPTNQSNNSGQSLEAAATVPDQNFSPPMPRFGLSDYLSVSGDTCQGLGASNGKRPNRTAKEPTRRQPSRAASSKTV